MAALSYSVAQSGRGGVAFISDEQVKAHITSIIQYTNTVSQAVSQIRLRGYDHTQVSFENNTVGGYANANCTEDDCKVFHVDGAGVAFLPSPTGAKSQDNWVFAANSVKGLVTSSPDLVMVLLRVDQEICQKINLKLHGTEVIPQASSTVGLTLFDGTYAAGAIVDSGGVIAGQTSYCMEGSGTPPAGTYFYYRALIGR